MNNLRVTRLAGGFNASAECSQCYRPLLLAGLWTVKTDEDSFVIADEVLTAIISPHNFEILIDGGKFVYDDGFVCMSG